MGREELEGEEESGLEGDAYDWGSEEGGERKVNGDDVDKIGCSLTNSAVSTVALLITIIIIAEYCWIVHVGSSWISRLLTLI